MPRKYSSARSLRGKSVYMNTNGGAWPYKFVRWVRTRTHSGQKPDRIEVGALVFVRWRTEAPFNVRPPRGFTKGHFVLRPYWSLYRTARDCYRRRRPITPPPPSMVRLFRDAR